MGGIAYIHTYLNIAQDITYYIILDQSLNYVLSNCEEYKTRLWACPLAYFTHIYTGLDNAQYTTCCQNFRSIAQFSQELSRKGQKSKKVVAHCGRIRGQILLFSEFSHFTRCDPILSQPVNFFGSYKFSTKKVIVKPIVRCNEKFSTFFITGLIPQFSKDLFEQKTNQEEK